MAIRGETAPPFLPLDDILRVLFVRGTRGLRVRFRIARNVSIATVVEIVSEA